MRRENGQKKARKSQNHMLLNFSGSFLAVFAFKNGSLSTGLDLVSVSK
jgi:hypothetical protein